MKHFFAGILGTVAAVSLHQWSEVASIAAGFGTFFYMAVCSVQKLKHKKYEKHKN